MDKITYNNAPEIKTAVNNGITVYWSNLSYQVIKDRHNEYMIKCGSHCIGLTWQDGETLNGKPEDFFSIT